MVSDRTDILGMGGFDGHGALSVILPVRTVHTHMSTFLVLFGSFPVFGPSSLNLNSHFERRKAPADD